MKLLFLFLLTASAACVDFEPEVGPEKPPLPPCAPMVKHADAGHDAATEQKDAGACSIEAGIAAYGPTGY